MAKNNTAGAPAAPATLEEALVLIEQLKVNLEASTKANDDLKAELEKSAKAATKAEAEHAKAIEGLKAELEDAANVIEDLKAQAELDKGVKSKGPVVTIGKKKYLVKAGTVINGKPYTKEDVAADKTLCESLIERGAKILIEIK